MSQTGDFPFSARVCNCVLRPPGGCCQDRPGSATGSPTLIPFVTIPESPSECPPTEHAFFKFDDYQVVCSKCGETRHV